MNYFTFYHIDESFIIDKKALRKAYLEKSREVHPDSQDQSIALEDSPTLDLAAYNNEAYTALNDSIGVIKHLLEVYEIPLDAKSVEMPPDFLMDMMDLNESIAALNTDGANLDGIVAQVDALEESINGQYLPALRAFAKDLPTEDKNAILYQARDYYLKLNYIKRLRENLMGSPSL